MIIGGFGGLVGRSQRKYTFNYNSRGGWLTQVFDRRARACATPPHANTRRHWDDCGARRNDHICSVVAERDQHMEKLVISSSTISSSNCSISLIIACEACPRQREREVWTCLSIPLLNISCAINTPNTSSRQPTNLMSGV